MQVAPWSIARAILELTALTTWLLQPDLSPSERIGRGMTIRLRSFEDAIQFGREIRSDSAPRIISEAQNGIVQLRKDAKSRKIPETLNKKERLIGFLGKFPETASLIKMAFDDAYLYRLLSGLAHGRPVSTRREVPKP